MTTTTRQGFSEHAHVTLSVEMLNDSQSFLHARSDGSRSVLAFSRETRKLHSPGPPKSCRRQWSLVETEHLRYRQLNEWDAAMQRLDEKHQFLSSQHQLVSYAGKEEQVGTLC